MTDDTRRIAVLDGLRALAIGLVLARHSIRYFWPDVSQPFDAIGIPFLNGWIGVDLFFVLSGFLITQQLLKIHRPEGYTRKDIGGYMKRRFMRIAPAYYVVLTVLCLGLIPHFPQASPETVWGWRYVYHILFLQDYWPPDINVVFWSLAIEMKFYLAAPFLVAFLLKFKSGTRYMMIGGLMALMLFLRYMTATVWAAPFTDYESFFLVIRNQFHLNLDGLLVGMLCAMLWNHPESRQWLERKKTANIVFYAGAGVIALLVFSAPILQKTITLFDKTLLMTVLAGGFGAMMLGLLGGASAEKIFSARPLAYISRVSYSLYLIHMPMLSFAMIAVNLIPDLSAHVRWLLTLPLFLALSFGVAGLLYKYVEKPAIDWAKS